MIRNKANRKRSSSYRPFYLFRSKAWVKDFYLCRRRCYGDRKSTRVNLYFFLERPREREREKGEEKFKPKERLLSSVDKNRDKKRIVNVLKKL